MEIFQSTIYSVWITDFLVSTASCCWGKYLDSIPVPSIRSMTSVCKNRFDNVAAAKKIIDTKSAGKSWYLATNNIIVAATVATDLCRFWTWKGVKEESMGLVICWQHQIDAGGVLVRRSTKYFFLDAKIVLLKSVRVSGRVIPAKPQNHGTKSRTVS